MPGDTTLLQVKKKGLYMDFLKTHCNERDYVFSVKKCGKDSCKFGCAEPRLPADVFSKLHCLPDPEPSPTEPDHYSTFDELYGKAQLFPDQFCPSRKGKPGNRPGTGNRTGSAHHGLPFNPTAHTASNVGMVVCCFECNKARCLHSRAKLKSCERPVVAQFLETVDYSCGSSMNDIDCDESSVLKKLFVRENVDCQTPIELPYYSAKYPPICYYCGTEPDEDAMEDKGHYPLCADCRNLQPLIPIRTRAFKAKR